MRMHTRYEKIGPARKKQIDKHDEDKQREEIELPEDVRVTHSGDDNPHDG
jgi:hypothetical protein